MKHICGVPSQKLAVHLAGLGWIGKSCLLITSEHGPRVRWVTVRTDTPLFLTGTPMEQKCGACTACVAIFPRHAFNGRIFYKEEPRKARFDAVACDQYFRKWRRRALWSAACACISAHMGKNQDPGSVNKRKYDFF